MDGRLGSLLARLRTELRGATGELDAPGSRPGWVARRARVEIAWVASEGGDGDWRVQPVGETLASPASAVGTHRAVVEFEYGTVEGSRAGNLTAESGARSGNAVERAGATGGAIGLTPTSRPTDGAANAAPLDAPAGTLRRRLELVLGGPPGFTTGAKAGILADLLVEFDGARVLEALRREWICEFDTSPEASSSVSQPGSTS